MLLHAFEALVEHVPARLTVVGSDGADVARVPRRPGGAHDRIDALGRVSAERALAAPPRGRPALRALARRRELRHGPDRGVRRRAPRCSPPNIAGYADVVDRRRRRDPRARPPTRSGSPRSCRRSASIRSGSRRMGDAARESAAALRLAAGRRAGRGRLRARRSTAPRAAHRVRGRSRAGSAPRPADGGDARPRPRLPSPRPGSGDRRRPPPRPRAGSALGVAGALGVGLTFIAAQRIGVDTRRRRASSAPTSAGSWSRPR